MKRVELAVALIALGAAFGMVRFAAAGPADLLPNGTAPHAAPAAGSQSPGASREPTEIGAGSVQRERTFTPPPARFGNADDRRSRPGGGLEREPRPHGDRRESRAAAPDRGETNARVDRPVSKHDDRGPRQEIVERRDRLDRGGDRAERQQRAERFERRDAPLDRPRRFDRADRDFGPQRDIGRDRRASGYAPRHDLDRAEPRYRRDDAFRSQPRDADDRDERRGYRYDDARGYGDGRRGIADGYAPRERWMRPSFASARTDEGRRTRFGFEPDRPAYRPARFAYRPGRPLRYSRVDRDAQPYVTRRTTGYADYGYGRAPEDGPLHAAPIFNGYAYGPSAVPSYEYNGGYTTIGTGYQGGYGSGCGLTACTCSVGYVD